MSSNSLIQTRIDADIKLRASAVLEKVGLTVSDAVRILLTRIANEGAIPLGLTTDPETYDAWFRTKVQEAIEDVRPTIAHEEVEAKFAKRRAKLAKTLR